MNFFIPFLNWFSTNKYRNINHIVDSSPWPLLMSLSVCQLLLSLMYCAETVIIFSFVQLFIFLWYWAIALKAMYEKKLSGPGAFLSCLTFTQILNISVFFQTVKDLFHRFFKKWMPFLLAVFICCLLYINIDNVNAQVVNKAFPFDQFDHVFLEKIKRRESAEVYNRIVEIYSCSDRYFIYWYLAYYDIALHMGPWTEIEIHRASLAVKPQTLIAIADAAKQHCVYYSPDWQPPSTYLTKLAHSDWMEYGPDLFFERFYIILTAYITGLLLALLWAW